MTLGLKDYLHLTAFGYSYSFCVPVKGAPKTQTMLTKQHGVCEDLQSILLHGATLPCLRAA